MENRIDIYDELQRVFDHKKEELLKAKQAEEQKKQEVNEKFAEAYIELIKEAINSAKEIDVAYSIELSGKKIDKCINLDNVKRLVCYMNNFKVEIIINFSKKNNFKEAEDSVYYDNELINRKFNGLGLDVTFKDTTVIICFVRKGKVNKPNESEQPVYQSKGLVRTLGSDLSRTLTKQK